MRTLNRTFLTLYPRSGSKTQRELGDGRIDLVRDFCPPVEKGGSYVVRYRLAGTETTYSLDPNIREAIENTIERERARIIAALEKDLRASKGEDHGRIRYQMERTTGLEKIKDKAVVDGNVGVQIQFGQVYWDDRAVDDDEE